MTLYGNKPGRKTELSGGPAAYLNDQLHQGLHPPTAEGDQIQVGLPGRRQPAENAVPNNDQHHGQVDGPMAGRPEWRPSGQLLRGQIPGLI